MQIKIGDLYANFRTSIVTTSFRTPFSNVGRGVLQGDCLSLLIFNVCFNFFIKYISAPKFAQSGFSTNSLYPINLFQFTDDAAVTTSLERANQVLLNHFTRWCSWAAMTIRDEKYMSFGIKNLLIHQPNSTLTFQ